MRVKLQVEPQHKLFTVRQICRIFTMGRGDGGVTSRRVDKLLNFFPVEKNPFPHDNFPLHTQLICSSTRLLVNFFSFLLSFLGF